MNKLIGTSGQLFSVIAEINSRGTVRSGKGSGGQGTPDSSFRNLLHTALPDDAKQKELIKEYVAYQGTASEFWQSLRTGGKFTTEEVDSVQFSSK